MNRERFQTEVLPLKDKLFRLALRITLNREDAEDIVQDTMLRVWDVQEQWPNIQSMEAYCLTICRRLALDFVKRAAARNVSFNPEQHDRPMASGSEQKEEVRLIRQAMDQLPEAQRTIMQLRDVEEHSYAEIAELTEMTESQVKVYLHRARKKIKTIIEQIESYGL